MTPDGEERTTLKVRDGWVRKGKREEGEGRVVKMFVRERKVVEGGR